MIHKEKTRWCEKEGIRIQYVQFGNFGLAETSLATSTDNCSIDDFQDKGLELKASKAISNKQFI